MNLLIKAEVKKIKRLKITSVGYISILLSALITYIQAFAMQDGAITFLNFTDTFCVTLLNWTPPSPNESVPHTLGKI